MMMALGQFVFSLDTLAFQELQRQIQWRHPSTSRVGARPARQFLGVGEDTLSMSGLLVPEFAGDVLSLAELEEMGNSGEQFPLVDGIGEVYGQYVIENLSTTGTIFTQDGRPRRIEFHLQLARKDDDATNEAAATPAEDLPDPFDTGDLGDLGDLGPGDLLAAAGFDGLGDDIAGWADMAVDIASNGFNPAAELQALASTAIDAGVQLLDGLVDDLAGQVVNGIDGALSDIGI